MADEARLASREFQLTYQKLTAPVKVTGRGAKVLGTWYPAGTETASGSALLAEKDAEIKRLKAELAKRPVAVPASAVTTLVPPQPPASQDAVREMHRRQQEVLAKAFPQKQFDRGGK